MNEGLETDGAFMSMVLILKPCVEFSEASPLTEDVSFLIADVLAYGLDEVVAFLRARPYCLSLLVPFCHIDDEIFIHPMTQLCKHSCIWPRVEDRV